MNASQEIDESESRDLLLDLETAYNGFSRLLHDE